MRPPIKFKARTRGGLRPPAGAEGIEYFCLRRRDFITTRKIFDFIWREQGKISRIFRPLTELLVITVK